MSDVLPRPVSGVWGALSRWTARVDLGRKLAIGLTVAALASGIATYAALTGAGPIAREPRLVLLLLNADLALLLALGALVARRLVRVWAERRRGLAGSGLHSRLVVLFSLVAVAPTIIVTVFAALFLNFGVHSWFSDKVRTAVNESLVVAHAYLDEHQQTVRLEALAMANDLNRGFPTLADDQARFDQFVSTQAALRKLEEAIVFTTDGSILARSTFSFALQFEDPTPEWAMEQAQPGQAVILTGGRKDRVRALVRLDTFPVTYLLVGRSVEPLVLAHTQHAEEAVKAYQQTEVEGAGMQITSVLLFAVVALLLLLAAIWIGLTFATSLARPISNLIAMAERVRAGDLAARVVEGPRDDELATLSRAFNRMTDQVEAQRTELIEANRQLDSRRRFTEAVLAGVSAGVIGLDGEGRVNLPNRHASTLLGVELEQFIGKRLDEAVPEMAELLAAAARRPERLVETQISVTREGRSRTLLARLAAERRGEDATGFVLTFDDVTELLTAQRQAAWADVARRIAHEIKNPLTPIQLSAERLKRRYLKEIQSDPETFRACTDTIVRQVGDIGRMVDEFSAFARMPAPVLRPIVVQSIAEEAVFLQRNAGKRLSRVDLDMPKQPLLLICDARQLRQALTNLLQNAADAIEGREPAPGATLPPGRIQLNIALADGATVITVADNGKGLPAEGRERLTEPYMTTRTKGTGLGLAIVRKIAEDHGGRLELADREGGGARVSVILPGGTLAETPDSGADNPVKRTAVHGT